MITPTHFPSTAVSLSFPFVFWNRRHFNSPSVHEPWWPMWLSNPTRFESPSGVKWSLFLGIMTRPVSTPPCLVGWFVMWSRITPTSTRTAPLRRLRWWRWFCLCGRVWVGRFITGRWPVVRLPQGCYWPKSHPMTLRRSLVQWKYVKVDRCSCVPVGCMNAWMVWPEYTGPEMPCEVCCLGFISSNCRLRNDCEMRCRICPRSSCPRWHCQRPIYTFLLRLCSNLLIMIILLLLLILLLILIWIVIVLTLIQ